MKFYRAIMPNMLNAEPTMYFVLLQNKSCILYSVALSDAVESLFLALNKKETLVCHI